MSSSSKNIVHPEALERLISTRRTSKPSNFDGREPGRDLLRRCIDVARKAPNHHRTEPAYFYLLGRNQILEVAKLNAERVAGESSSTNTLERAKRKEEEWGKTPGLLIVTCYTDLNSKLVRSKPNTIGEDYAAVCCMTQNLLLLLHNHGIATKWSTAPVWDTPRFSEVVGLKYGEPDERMVALIFHGFSEVRPNDRSFMPLDAVLVDGGAS
ncbi:MAG: nitroreductase family protein [Opitutales bacterium]